MLVKAGVLITALMSVGSLIYFIRQTQKNAELKREGAVVGIRPAISAIIGLICALFFSLLGVFAVFFSTTTEDGWVWVLCLFSLLGCGLVYAAMRRRFVILGSEVTFYPLLGQSKSYRVSALDFRSKMRGVLILSNGKRIFTIGLGYQNVSTLFHRIRGQSQFDA